MRDSWYFMLKLSGIGGVQLVVCMNSCCGSAATLWDSDRIQRKKEACITDENYISIIGNHSDSCTVCHLSMTTRKDIEH